MGKLDEIEIHEGCSDNRCRRCMDACDALEKVLVAALGNRYDWLGLYHSWLTQNGVNAESPGGWFSREALSDANVARFLAPHVDIP